MRDLVRPSAPEIAAPIQGGSQSAIEEPALIRDGRIECEHCGAILEAAGDFYVDEFAGVHYFCNEPHKDAWKDSLSAHERLVLTGETGL